MVFDVPTSKEDYCERYKLLGFSPSLFLSFCVCCVLVRVRVVSPSSSLCVFSVVSMSLASLPSSLSLTPSLSLSTYRKATKRGSQICARGFV